MGWQATPQEAHKPLLTTAVVGGQRAPALCRQPESLPPDERPGTSEWDRNQVGVRGDSSDQATEFCGWRGPQIPPCSTLSFYRRGSWMELEAGG